VKSRSPYKWLIVLGLVAIVLLLPRLLHDPFIVRIIIMTLIALVVLLGLNIIVGLTGQVSLCQAAFYGAGAYCSAILTMRAGIPFWISLPLAGVLTGLLAFVLSRFTVTMRSHYLALATIGLSEILVNVFRSADKWTGGANGLSSIPPPRIGAWSIDTYNAYYYIAVFVAGLAYLSIRRIARSRTGTCLYAVRDNELAAASLGIDTARLKISGFTLGAIYAGVSGALYAHFDGFIGPELFSTGQSILLFCALVVGGLGRGFGSLLAAVLLVIIQEYFRSFVQYQVLLFGATVILIMVFAPQGAAGILSRLGAYKLFKTSKLGAPNGAKAVWTLEPQSEIAFVTTETPESGHPTDDSRSLVQARPIADALLFGEDRASDVTAQPQLRRRGPNNSPQDASSDDVFSIEDIHVHFNGVIVLKNVSFSLESEKVLCCLIGPNGAGKTTLLDVLGGQLRPERGRAFLTHHKNRTSKLGLRATLIGKPSHGIARLGVSRTFQTSQLFSELTVLENVTAAACADPSFMPSLSETLFRPFKSAAKDRAATEAAEGWLRFTGLWSYRNEPAMHLPYGLRRVLEIARCLATGPTVMLLDEPSAGMNHSERETLERLLLAIKRLGITILLVTHDLDLVRDLADRVVVLDQGEVIFQGRAGQLRSDARVVTAYLGKRKESNVVN
jgi:ABC-type branched-subunit amino acid transport system permease subunit/ABC-type branched-subunit amino acid transport system ATPase component